MCNMLFNQGVKDKDGILIEDKISNKYYPKGFKYLFIKSAYFESEKDYSSSIQIQISGNYLDPIKITKSTTGCVWVFYDRHFEFKDRHIEIKAICQFPFKLDLACEYRNDNKN